MQLDTSYLGMHLPHPFIAGASAVRLRGRYREAARGRVVVPPWSCIRYLKSRSIWREKGASRIWIPTISASRK
jgi:hypothetical protein